jgi:Ca2+-binding EF-hand superfamily protein
MISDVDDDGSGTIGYPEFLKMMTHKILNRDPKDEILKAFRLFDDDETGKISFKNLKRVAKELGERMTDEELQEMRAGANNFHAVQLGAITALLRMLARSLVCMCTL